MDLFSQLQTGEQGLTAEEASRRLAEAGTRIAGSRPKIQSLKLFLSQFKSPIILILLFAALLSLILQDHAGSLIIFIIVVISGILGFWQERGAALAVEKLLAMVQIKATVLRSGHSTEVPTDRIVPGDVVLLRAGDIIPGDGLLLESKDLFVGEATLTGETFPVEKTCGILPSDTPLSQRANALFMGTHVVNGTAKLLVAYTGKQTEFGKVSETLKLRPPETEFERGIREFGYLLMEVTLILVIAIFGFNVYLSRPVLDSFFFALALAVGLTPQLLPAIISVNLAYGAKHMAKKKVIVKQLSSIENFGSMDILCSDKTGTLTEGAVKLYSANELSGEPSDKVLLYAYLNALFQAGYTNPIDEAIVNHGKMEVVGYKKLDEEPYDFIRKRLSVLVEGAGTHLIITKGALSNVLDVCADAEASGGKIVALGSMRERIESRFKEWCAKGYRVLGLAYRDLGGQVHMTKDSEAAMTFLGFLVFYDPLRAEIKETIASLRDLGVSLKVITGDNRIVAENASGQAGLACSNIITGVELREMSHEALRQRVNQADVFAEVEPNQKERIIRALKQTGHVVGYMGDGINDASALHAADVGISVANAVDVAKEAADIVLLEKDLNVLRDGIREGRTTFANTLKYVFMATSANFGNMFSMAGASLFLSFLPLLPTQILLNNLMTDFPEMTIATDSVDPELVEKPRRWDIGFIRRFMIVFGLANSACDYLTFGALLFLLHADVKQFRTGWFIENIVTAALIVLVIRTRRPFYKSKPGGTLMLATFLIVAVTLVFPYTPLARVFGFKPLSGSFLVVLLLIMIFYVVVAEIAKFFFYRRVRL